MKLSIIIPVYNEENNIEQVISEVKKIPLRLEKEIIIVDDASKDKTRQILKKYSKSAEIKIILLKQNSGKGFAIREGLKTITGEIVLIQDADLEYSIADYPAILAPFFLKKAKVVYGSRFLGEITGMRLQNLLANKILTFTANILYNIILTDEATAYKAFRSEVIKKLSLKCERFEFCPEVTAKLAKRGYKIYEVPIHYQARDTKSGKKIKLRDAFEAIWTLIKYRFKD